MVPAICIMYGLVWRYRETFPEHLPSKNWWFGVCADVSKTLGIHLIEVKFFVLLYTLLGLGRLFYFIYYGFNINRVSISPLTPEDEIQVTKIKSCYCGL